MHIISNLAELPGVCFGITVFFFSFGFVMSLKSNIYSGYFCRDYEREINSTGFFFEILIIGNADERSAVNKLIPSITKTCRNPNRAKATKIFIVSII